ncbi:MAG: glycosyltransferase family 2 protein [Methyloceanibacter sp.]
MPPVPPNSLGTLVGFPVFVTLSWLGYLITKLFFAAIWLGVVRVVLLCGIGLGNRRAETRRVAPSLPQPAPLRSVLIPAFNEAKVIVQSIRRILASDYSNLEVIVIDDGSIDGTSDRVREHFADDPRVTFDGDTLRKVLIYYLAFLLIDLTSAVIALAMERKEKWSLAPWLVLQRFGYRQLMYYIVVKALLTAALGPLVGWGKLERKSTVAEAA